VALMRTNTRVVSRRPPPRGSRIGSTLVGLGFVSILSVVFFGGVVAGRHYPKLLPSLGGTAVAKEPRRGTDGRLAERGKSVEPAPVLTFYQELTAPLTSPPPASKPKPDRAKPAALAPDTARAAAASEKTDVPVTHAMSAPVDQAAPAPTDRVELPASAPAAPAEPRGTRYTVQVGAFGQREQAEAIRARLAAAGHDAFVADLDAPAATRFRV